MLSSKKQKKHSRNGVVQVLHPSHDQTEKTTMETLLANRAASKLLHVTQQR